MRSAGLPYGYTITVWSTAQATIAAHGPPPVGFIALFALAAVTAYWLLRTATAENAPDGPGDVSEVTAWLIQAAAVAVPVGTMAVAAQLLPRALCWPLAGAVTVLGYLGVTGIGSALSRRPGDR